MAKSGAPSRLETSRRKQPRRRWVWLAAGAAALMLGGELYLSNFVPEITRVSIPLARLPAEFEGLRVAHLSDLHGKSFGRRNETVLRLLEAEKPDLICVTGDLIDGLSDAALNARLTWADTQLARLTAIAPVYFVTGNHEWGADYQAAREGRERPLPRLRALLDRHGAVWLDHRYVTLERGTASIVLAGLTDPNGPADQTDPGPLMARIRAREGDAFVLALSHRFDRLDEYEALGLDLTLAGHAHGGVIRPPFTEGLFGPGRELFPRQTGGVYRQGDAVMAVSRGMGDTYLPRLWNRPEIGLYILVREG
ncbi:MAG: metallophosphoesterase [Oscillospiraceae bacterium]|nr:metallophosphoesterase [Oscillospiraceae bacterium]